MRQYLSCCGEGVCVLGGGEGRGGGEAEVEERRGLTTSVESQ